MRINMTCRECGVEFSGRSESGKTQIYCNPPCAYEGKRAAHGGVGTTEYKAWEHMRDRCNNQRNHAYARYGGRGIKVCPQWDYAGDGFATFLADMGHKPSPEYTLDRTDNDGGYRPDNCRWATRTEQSRNRGMCMPAEHQQAIRDGIEQHLSFRQIAKSIGRTVGSVSTWAYRRGLKSGYELNKRSGSMTAHPGSEQFGESR